jgi:hypothetical protein
MEAICPWGGYARAEYVGCEPDLCAWIVHPAETWSNLAFIAVAAALIVRYGRTDRHLAVAWFPFIVIGIGIASAAFHASLMYWLHAVDLAAIFVLTGFLLAANLRHAGMIGADRFPVVFLILAAAGTALAFADQGQALTWLVIIVIAGQGCAIVWSAWRIPARGPRRELVAAIALNQVAAVALWLDRGHVLCTGGVLTHVVQPHSFWHIVSALSLLFFYRYERAVEHVVHGSRVSNPSLDQAGSGAAEDPPVPIPSSP